MYFFRFLASYVIEPRFFIGFSLALDRYCEEEHLNCLKFAGALDYMLKGRSLVVNLWINPFNSYH